MMRLERERSLVISLGATMLNRVDYIIENGRTYMAENGLSGPEERARLFDQYYGEISDAIGFAPSKSLVQLCRSSINLDGCWNDIALGVWCRVAAPLRQAIDREMRKRGDFLTDAGAVCVVKAGVARFFNRELSIGHDIDGEHEAAAPSPDY